MRVSHFITSLYLMPLVAWGQPASVSDEALDQSISWLDRLTGVFSPVAPKKPEWVPAMAFGDGLLVGNVSFSESARQVHPVMPNAVVVDNWQIVGSADPSQSNLRWQWSPHFWLDAKVDTLTLVNGVSVPLASVVPCLTETLSSACSSRLGPSATAVAGDVRIGQLLSDAGVDLSYGFSWLKGGGYLSAPLSAGPRDAGLPVVFVPGVALPYGLDSGLQFSARGRWELHSGLNVNVGTQVARDRLMMPLGVSSQYSDLQHTSLSVGLGAGSLQGSLVGHLLNGDQIIDPALGKRWTSVDLGISWRTPWRGELSVGAQNVWAAPADPVNTGADAAQNRTPYVRYRQDL